MRSPGRPPGRALRADEVRLWREVAATVRQRADARLDPPLVTGVADATSPETQKADRTARSPKNPVERSSRANPEIEPSLRRRLVAGRRPVDAALDLHGYRQNEAHARLASFLSSAHRDGKRVVLIVTGKGRTEGDGASRGVLRRLVPLWLEEPRLASMIVAVASAGRHHGGDGALYVHLRNPARRLR